VVLRYVTSDALVSVDPAVIASVDLEDERVISDVLR
jgi:hypothetical protein